MRVSPRRFFGWAKSVQGWFISLQKPTEVGFLRYVSRSVVSLTVVVLFFSPFSTAIAANPPPPTAPESTIFTLANATAKVEKATGALTQRIPLDLPPGRNGLQPDLKLEYSSQNTDVDNIVGYGWSLSVPYISRLNKTGSQDLYGYNPYFTSSIDGELATSSSATTTITATSTVPVNVSYLIVGGGSGFNNPGFIAGGGAGGGKVATGTTSIIPGSAYTVTVGTVGGPNASGNTSSFNGLAAQGGVATGVFVSGIGQGGSVNTTGQAAQGSGNGAGGGGGNSGPGGSGTNNGGGNGNGGGGGAGTASSIKGTSLKYGGGAGGQGTGAGSVGLGQDGGMNGDSTGGRVNSGGGGEDGIVVIAAPVGAITATGGTHTVAGGNDIWTFTSTGTWTPATTTQATIAVSTTFAARIDTGGHNSYTYSTSTNCWIMYDNKGTKYLFGSSAQSQQSATTSPTQVYKWMLEKVTDTNGNFVRYVYRKEGNQIYPYQIIYTGNGVTDGPTVVTFATSTRTDYHSDYKTGFRVTTNYLVSQITASFNGSNVLRYDLSYTTGVNGTRALLSRVQQSGWNAQGTLTSLPPTTFGYIASTTLFMWPGAKRVEGPGWIVGDLKGNGKNSISVFYRDPNTGTVSGKVYEDGSASPTSITVPDYWASVCAGCTDANPPSEHGTRFLDLNGSGKKAIVSSLYNYTSGTSTTSLYVPAPVSLFSWNSTGSWNGVIPYFAEDGSGTIHGQTLGIFGDVNGTGLPSFEQRADGWGLPAGAYIANGSAWNQGRTDIFAPATSLPYGTSTPNNPQLIDLNGDGLGDWISSTATSTNVYINTGFGWESRPDAQWAIATGTLYSTNSTTYYDRGVRFIDVNGDGFPDFVHSYTGVAPGEVGTFSQVFLNTGHGFATTTLYTLPAPITTVDGSGNTTFNEYQNWFGNGQQAQDVISSITYPRGGSTDVTYGYTTQGDNPDLPYSILTVTKLVNHNGQGSNEQTTFGYAGGRQYLPSFAFDRKFAGFWSATTTTMDGSVVTHFSQGATTTAAGDQSDGYPQLGYPFLQEVFSPAGAPVKKTFYRYDAYWHGNSVFVGLGRQVEQNYRSDGTHRDKATDFTYSTSTNDLLSQYEYGEVVGNTDGTFSTNPSLGPPRTTVFTYAASSTVNMTVPIQKTMFDGGNATTSDSKYIYDTLAFGQVKLGNQTQEQNLVASSTYASTTKIYNGYGLVTNSLDANGKAWVYFYDSFFLYFATTSNPVGQQTTYAYNYANGKVATSTNPNGGTIRNSYDGVGRLVQVEQSDPASPTSLLVKSQLSYTDSTTTPSLIRQTDYLNSASTTDTYAYYDGLNRLIQKRKNGPTTGVSTVVDTIYNATGGVASTSLPYFSTGITYAAATTTPYLYTHYYYDALKRVASSTNSVGTTTSAYPAWTTTSVDPNGNIKDYVYDAYNNLTQVVEHFSSGNATTTYAYDLLGNLSTTTDALGNIRTFTYDRLGRRLTATDLHPVGASNYGTWTYVYDANGNLTSQTDPRGLVSALTYDNFSRLTTDTVNGVRQITNTYDSCTNGKSYVCTASSTLTKIDYVYDVLGQVTISTSTIATSTLGVNSYATSYAYDRQGNVTTVTNPNGTQINYIYNLAGLVSSANAVNAGTTNVAKNITYAPTGAISQISFGSGATTTYTYDPAQLNRLTQILTISPNATTSIPAYSPASTTISYLVVGGGGGGGYANGSGSGGGGAGGFLTGTTSIISGTAYPITVGSGGAGGVQTTPTPAQNGQDSLFNGIDALGGGRGCSGGHSAGSGGSGGGGISESNCLNGGSGTAGQGNKGGKWSGAGNPSFGGGGGGASAAGSDTTSTQAGNGGNGLSSNLSGSLVTYAGGGGGGCGDTSSSYTGGSGGTGGGGASAACTSTQNGAPGSNGTANTGGGGGGATTGQLSHVNGIGGTGGSGIVIIAASTTAGITATGGTHTVVGNNDIWTFTTSGTWIPSINSANCQATSTPVGGLQNLTYTYDANGNILTKIDNASTTNSCQKTVYTYDKRDRLTSASTTPGYVTPFVQNYSFDVVGNLLSGPDGTYSYAQTSGANPHAATKTVYAYGGSAQTIEYDNSTLAGNGSNVSSLTFSHTMNTSTSTGLMVVSVDESATGGCVADVVTGVTYNGASLTNLGYTSTNTTIGHTIKTYYGFAPAQGAHNVVVTGSASCIRYAVAATYIGVKQSGFPDASGTGNPLNSSGAVNFFQATTTTSANNAWALLVGLPSNSNVPTAGANTTIRQGQSGEIYFADSNTPISPAGATGLNWSTGSATNWLANYFSIPPTVSTAPTVVTTNYGYDRNGNLTAASTTSSTSTYTYDFANRIVSMTAPGQVFSYGYDTAGNRTIQVSRSAVTVYPTKYFTQVSTTTGVTTTATSTDYIWVGNQLLGTIDRATVNGVATGTPVVSYYHQDNLNSTNVVSNSAGRAAQTFTYAPYGTILASTTDRSIDARRQYIGQYTDTSGLDYLNARYYDPMRGQFLSQDPMFLGDPRQQNLQDPQSLNSYSYANDNPINLSDSTGKQAIEIVKYVAWGLYASGIIKTAESFYSNIVLPYQYPTVYTQPQSGPGVYRFVAESALNFGPQALPKEEGRIIADSLLFGADYIPDSLSKGKTKASDPTKMQISKPNIEPFVNLYNGVINNNAVMSSYNSAQNTQSNRSTTQNNRNGSFAPTQAQATAASAVLTKFQPTNAVQFQAVQTFKEAFGLK